MQPDEDLSRAYVNADFIPDAAGFPPRWREAAAAFRARLGARARTGLRYGAGARQVFDLFLPEDTPRGLMVFIHGGYWMSFAPEDWSAFAAGALARGWACAMPGYTLAPDARIAASPTRSRRRSARRRRRWRGRWSSPAIRRAAI
jgi:arylformamidase